MESGTPTDILTPLVAPSDLSSSSMAPYSTSTTFTSASIPRTPDSAAVRSNFLSSAVSPVLVDSLSGHSATPPETGSSVPDKTMTLHSINSITSSSITSLTSLPVSSMASQNKVSTVILHGIPIVALVIEGKERLCLAQISTTLLKEYSYNEIHNRRVALGITCVQCTPVQLEILRRAGAMPVSSRRCGMISKREAERLVKSFLEDTTPPKLPDNFAFEVYHECGWGATGRFLPSRYNSSRAKCIKCDLCSLYFSPNKFIFHYHRTSESSYQHPDAANFNSWRRHLHLKRTEADDVVHAWEDVKAMFNGGSRKRLITASNKHPPRQVEKPDKTVNIGHFYPTMFPNPYPLPPVIRLPFERPLSPMKPNQFWPIHSPVYQGFVDENHRSRLTPISNPEPSQQATPEDSDSESDIDIMDTTETETERFQWRVDGNDVAGDHENEVSSSCCAKPEISEQESQRKTSEPEDNERQLAMGKKMSEAIDDKWRSYSIVQQYPDFRFVRFN